MSKTVAWEPPVPARESDLSGVLWMITENGILAGMPADRPKHTPHTGSCQAESIAAGRSVARIHRLIQAHPVVPSIAALRSKRMDCARLLEPASNTVLDQKRWRYIREYMLNLTDSQRVVRRSTMGPVTPLAFLTEPDLALAEERTRSVAKAACWRAVPNGTGLPR